MPAIVHGIAVVPIVIEANAQIIGSGKTLAIDHPVLNEVQSTQALMARDFSAINPTTSPLVGGLDVSANPAVIGISELHFKVNGRHAIAQVNATTTRFAATSGQGALPNEQAFDGTINFTTDLGFQGSVSLRTLLNPVTGKFTSLYRELNMHQGGLLVGIVLKIDRSVPAPAPTPAPGP